MIAVVPSYLYVNYRRELHEMYRLRHRVFKERMGWDVGGEGGEERDQYDDLDPVYFLAINEQHSVVGSCRLLPTTGRYMLRNEFPQLLGGQRAPSDPLIWECSRFVVDNPDDSVASLAAVGQITREIFCAFVEYCYEAGITEVLAVYDVRLARILPRIGCRPKWLSSIQTIGKTKALTGRFDVNEQALAAIRRAGHIEDSVIANTALLRAANAA